jgi:hypothetical protein
MSRSQAKPDPDVVAVLSRVARSMRERTDGVEILQSITEAALDAVPGADFASIAVIRSDGSLTTLAPTSETAREADRVRHELGAAPGLGQLSKLGIRSVLGVDISRTGTTHAVLNLYSRTARDFEAGRHIAELFASQAAIAMSFVETTETLEAALASRQTIGQAVGIVMERYQVDEDTAFSYLVRTSQDTNVKLRVVARQTVDRHNRGRSAASD